MRRSLHRNRFHVGMAACAAATALLAALACPPASAAGSWFNQVGGPGTTVVNVNGTFTPVVGNFAGSPLDDILWFSPTGTDQLWINHDDLTFTKQPLARQLNGAYTPIVGDFAGDDYDDIFWYGPGSTQDYLWIGLTNGLFNQQLQTVSGSYQPFVVPDATFGGAATDDIVWYAPGSGGDVLWNFNTPFGGHATVPLSIAGSPKPVVGDFDGNGYADVVWYNAGPTSDPYWRGTNGAGGFTKTSLTVNGTFTPLVEDFTPSGDGFSDILWFGSGTAPDALWQGSASGTFARSNQTITHGGRAISLDNDWGYVYFADPGAVDSIWYDDAPIYDKPCGCAEIPSGYTPLRGSFASTDTTGVFWYKPGTAPEYLFVV